MKWGIFRGICIGLLLCSLIFTACVFAIEKNKSFTAQDVLSFKLPSDWGLLRNSFNSGTDKLVINIQDAHANLEAQQNIAKIISLLVKKYSLEHKYEIIQVLKKLDVKTDETDYRDNIERSIYR